jgi:hypothetical protein
MKDSQLSLSQKDMTMSRMPGAASETSPNASVRRAEIAHPAPKATANPVMPGSENGGAGGFSGDGRPFRILRDAMTISCVTFDVITVVVGPSRPLKNPVADSPLRI